MIQIVNGLEMSLAMQYFDDWLISIKEQNWNFSRTEKLLETVISSGTGQTHLFWVRDFVNTDLKIILEDNFQPGACNVNPLLRNLEYNNSTQNQNVFQTTAKNLLGTSSVNIKFSWIHSIGL